MKAGRRSHLFAALALCLALAPRPADAVEEMVLKAAIVYNILLFVEWPESALPAPGGALSLCIAPHAAMREALQAIDRSELRGFVLALRELAGADAAKPCHAVVIDAADRHRLAASLKAQRLSGALVISDDLEAPADSTAIVLHRVGSKIVFDVNLRPLRQAGLQLSSKLMRLARVVRE
ncbi:MAG TPA: YfiR family protein [Albitalea sp.]|uniref:YfiR family protein n=1 Tax=Piscinibacter sp. TaxID=1903157 RepID=UPI002ED41DD4